MGVVVLLLPYEPEVCGKAVLSQDASQKWQNIAVKYTDKMMVKYLHLLKKMRVRSQQSKYTRLAFTEAVITDEGSLCGLVQPL